MKEKKKKATVKRSLPEYKPPYEEKIRDEATPEEKKDLSIALRSLEVKRPRWWTFPRHGIYYDMVGVFLFEKI